MNIHNSSPWASNAVLEAIAKTMEKMAQEPPLPPYQKQSGSKQLYEIYGSKILTE